MPIRIYALAKELNIDSKELVDICTRAGVTGKGSALASLTDEEEVKVKAYLQGKSKPGAPSRPAAPQPPPPPPTKGNGAPPAAPPLPAAPKVLSREDYIAPAGNATKPAVLAPAASAPTKPPEPKKRETDPDKKREPVVKLAAIPESKGTRLPVKSAEPAPQKPIITLPPEAIRNARAGSSAPLREFTKQHEKRREIPPTKKPKAVVEHPPEVAPADRGPPKDRRRKDSGPDEDLAGMASARATRQTNRQRQAPRRPEDEEDDSESRRGRRRLIRTGTNTAAPRKGNVVVQLPCTVRTFSETTGVPSARVLKCLMTLGATRTVNAPLEPEMCELLAAELGLEVELRQPASLEDTVISQLEQQPDPPEALKPRPPVVTFLGHVDHGKTSLLDRIIGIDVVSGEAGGITQHIRAYQVKKDGRAVSFVDTPGHEAFTEMRARGANVTDIAVLVVAADDGVMPQTEEAISHAKAAGVPIVVALNKCDLPGLNEQRIFQQLSQHGLLPTAWGGDVEVVKTSAATGEGIDTLLETLLLTADLHEYTANPLRPAAGSCLESQQEGARGVVTKLMVKRGTLNLGDIIVCGHAYGRVKAMYDPLRPSKRLKSAGPSTPCNVTGLDSPPEAGEAFYVLNDISQAREIAETRAHRSRQQTLSGKTVRVSFEEFQRRLEEGRLGEAKDAVSLNLILRADVRGSIEAIEKELSKLEHPEVRINILQRSVGGITVADVTLAHASNAVIVGFNVIPDEAARALADQRGVEIRRYDIIYKITEDIRAMLEGKLEPEKRVAELGRALVQRVFVISKVGAVAGCRVLAGTIDRGCRVRVNRDGRGIGDYPLESLRREKDDAKQVREGLECGMKLGGFNDLKEGDVLEAYKIEEVARTL